MPKEKIVRTTIVIPSALDKHLEIIRIRQRSSKNQVIVQALRQFVQSFGLEPDKRPKIEVSY